MFNKVQKVLVSLLFITFTLPFTFQVKEKIYREITVTTPNLDLFWFPVGIGICLI